MHGTMNIKFRELSYTSLLLMLQFRTQSCHLCKYLQKYICINVLWRTHNTYIVDHRSSPVLHKHVCGNCLLRHDEKRKILVVISSHKYAQHSCSVVSSEFNFKWYRKGIYYQNLTCRAMGYTIHPACSAALGIISIRTMSVHNQQYSMET